MEKQQTMLKMNLVKLKNVNGRERFYYSFLAGFTGPDARYGDEFYFYIYGRAFKGDPSCLDVVFCSRNMEEAWAFLQEQEQRLKEDAPFLYDFVTWDVIDPDGTVYPGGVIPA